MNTLESHEKTPYQAVEEVVNSIEPADLDLLKEFVQLPENPDYQMLSDFIGHHGRGVVTTFIEKIESARDQIGASYQDFQRMLLQTLGVLEV